MANDFHQDVSRAMTLLQLQHELIEHLQATVLRLRADRDEARQIRARIDTVMARLQVVVNFGASYVRSVHGEGLDERQHN